MVTGDPVDVNLTMSLSSRKMPALLTKNSAQPCQIESCGGIMWIRMRPIDDDHHHCFWPQTDSTFIKLNQVACIPSF